MTSTRWMKLSALLLAIALLFTLAACGKTQTTTETQTQSAASNVETKAADPTAAANTPQSGAETTAQPQSTDAKTLVVYFSATGTTKGVAQTIASATGADLYEITAAQTYTEADLNWNDKNSRTTLEQNDKSVRPAIGSETISLDGYSTIFIGYPIWWGEEPRIMDTFVESYDLSGKTVIPFCTSGGSGIGSSGKNLEANAGGGNWLEGERLSRSSDVEGWIKSLGL